MRSYLVSDNSGKRECEVIFMSIVTMNSGRFWGANLCIMILLREGVPAERGAFLLHTDGDNSGK